LRIKSGSPVRSEEESEQFEKKNNIEKMQYDRQKDLIQIMLCTSKIVQKTMINP
jgi:hypothetical protein